MSSSVTPEVQAFQALCSDQNKSVDENQVVKMAQKVIKQVGLTQAVQYAYQSRFVMNAIWKNEVQKLEKEVAGFTKALLMSDQKALTTHITALQDKIAELEKIERMVVVGYQFNNLDSNSTSTFLSLQNMCGKLLEIAEKKALPNVTTTKTQFQKLTDKTKIDLLFIISQMASIPRDSLRRMDVRKGVTLEILLRSCEIKKTEIDMTDDLRICLNIILNVPDKQNLIKKNSWTPQAMELFGIAAKANEKLPPIKSPTQEPAKSPNQAMDSSDSSQMEVSTDSPQMEVSTELSEMSESSTNSPDEKIEMVEGKSVTENFDWLGLKCQKLLLSLCDEILKLKKSDLKESNLELFIMKRVLGVHALNGIDDADLEMFEDYFLPSLSDIQIPYEGTRQALMIEMGIIEQD